MTSRSPTPSERSFYKIDEHESPMIRPQSFIVSSEAPPSPDMTISDGSWAQKNVGDGVDLDDLSSIVSREVPAKSFVGRFPPTEKQFNIIVAGARGLGKTTAVDKLFEVSAFFWKIWIALQDRAATAPY